MIVFVLRKLSQTLILIKAKLVFLDQLGRCQSHLGAVEDSGLISLLSPVSQTLEIYTVGFLLL